MDKMTKVIRCMGVIALSVCNLAWADITSADSAILVEYQGAMVTKADLEAEMRRIPEKNRDEVLSSRQRIGQLLENLLLNRVFATEAKKMGLNKNPLFINELNLAEDRLLARDLLEARMQKISLPDFEAKAKELYKAYPEKYTVKAMADVSHILVAVKDGNKESALKRANDFYNQLLAGASIDELAKSHSDDRSAKKNSGRMGYFTAEQMVKEFSDAAFALEKAGDVSKPVESQFGYHVIKLHDKKMGGLLDYAVVRDGIINNLKEEYLTTARKDIVNSVRGSSGIKINEAEVAKLKKNILAIPESGAGQ